MPPFAENASDPDDPPKHVTLVGTTCNDTAGKRNKNLLIHVYTNIPLGSERVAVKLAEGQPMLSSAITVYVPGPNESISATDTKVPLLT